MRGPPSIIEDGPQALESATIAQANVEDTVAFLLGIQSPVQKHFGAELTRATFSFLFRSFPALKPSSRLKPSCLETLFLRRTQSTMP